METEKTGIKKIRSSHKAAPDLAGNLWADLKRHSPAAFELFKHDWEEYTAAIGREAENKS
ncbi:MAG: hypothetical protein V1676_03795 [Candidatus Diapherotrites archaeon]